MEVAKLNPIPIRIPRGDVLRRIGEVENHVMSGRTKQELRKATREVREHARGQAVYRTVPVESGKGSITLDGGSSFESRRLAEVFEPCDKAVLFVTTIGSDVDRLIRRNMERRPHYGFLLDATASVAAESTADYVQGRIQQSLGEDERTTLRYSPGYCDWALSEQKMLFRLLPQTAEIGVDLSPHSSLMSPRKSVSAALGICPVDSRSSGNACRNCPRTRCPHRRE